MCSTSHPPTISRIGRSGPHVGREGTTPDTAGYCRMLWPSLVAGWARTHILAPGAPSSPLKAHECTVQADLGDNAIT